MRAERSRYDGKESGFALILAILSLLLLTFLGLTLAATTTTELQIATNYRWSQQALYNAEAGLEVAKAYLKVIDPNALAPDVRPAWIQNPGSPLPLPAPFPQLPNPKAARIDAWGNAPRNYAPSENPPVAGQNCDLFGDGAGYGVVFDDGVTAGLPLQNVTQLTLPGGLVVGDLDGDGRPETMRGAFTVWVRRRLTYGAGGNPLAVQDDTDATNLILTAEGVAPAVGGHFNSGTASGRAFYANRATRVVEATVRVGVIPTGTCSGVLNQTSETGFRCDIVVLP